MKPPKETLHILQLEFFLVETSKILSLEKLYAEVLERRCDEAPLKFAVRIYDQSSSVSTVVSKLTPARAQAKLFLKKVFATRGIKQRVASLQHFLKQQSIRRGEALARELSVTQLREAILHKQPVAIERPDRSFRPLHPSEAHELLESVGAAKSVWMFVFGPNDLCADAVDVVGSVM